ncbi:MAG: hypothetical protein ACK56I_28615, partial [bacterium]
PARQEDENHRLRRTFLAFVLLDVRLSRLELEVLSQTETNTATKSDVQKASARLTRNHPSLSRNENTSRLPTRKGTVRISHCCTAVRLSRRCTRPQPLGFVRLFQCNLKFDPNPTCITTKTTASPTRLKFSPQSQPQIPLPTGPDPT